MKIWGIVRTNQKIVQNHVLNWEQPMPRTEGAWLKVLDELCQTLSLARPILMKKHMRELHQFSRTVFFPADFMEDVAFDRFEIELFEQKKKS
jgi:hypothetical protein